MIQVYVTKKGSYIRLDKVDGVRANEKHLGRVLVLVNGAELQLSTTEFAKFELKYRAWIKQANGSNGITSIK